MRYGRRFAHTLRSISIHASEDLSAAREKAIRVIEKLRGPRLSRAAELVETAVEETLTTSTLLACDFF